MIRQDSFDPCGNWRKNDDGSRVSRRELEGLRGLGSAWYSSEEGRQNDKERLHCIVRGSVELPSEMVKLSRTEQCHESKVERFVGI